MGFAYKDLDQSGNPVILENKHWISDYLVGVGQPQLITKQ